MSGFALGAGFGAAHRSGGGAGGSGISLPAMASLAGFGDSIVQGSAASDAAHQWLDLVAAGVGAGTPLNKGISGTVLQNSADAGGGARANNGRDRYAADLLGANQREGAMIAYGYNDARYTAAPATFNVTAFQNDLGEVVSGLVTGGYSRDKIVIVSPYYITDAGLGTGSTGFTGQTRAGFEAFVIAARDVAREHGTRFAHAYAWMRDHGGAALISGDNIHPNDAGHAAIATCVLAAGGANLAPLPGIAADVSVAGTLGFAITPPAGGGAVSDYRVDYAVEGSLVFGNSQTVAGTSGAWSGIANGSYRIRARANFADGSLSPWAFSGAATVAGAAFLVDGFAGALDTDITLHAPDSGGTWALQTGYSPATPAKLDGNGRVYGTSSSGVYRASATPSSADYAVEGVFACLSSLTGDNAGIAGRMQAASNNFYFVRFARSSNSWGLFKCVGGTNSQLGSSWSDAFASGSRTVRLVMNGSAISVEVDGVQRIGPVTDSAVTGAGGAGVRFGGSTQSASTGIHIDTLTAAAL